MRDGKSDVALDGGNKKRKRKRLVMLVMNDDKGRADMVGSYDISRVK
jgi:hypothetical protein